MRRAEYNNQLHLHAMNLNLAVNPTKYSRRRIGCIKKVKHFTLSGVTRRLHVLIN